MPPQRIPLGSVSGNRQFNHELTPYQRGVAIGMTFKGAKSSEIEVALDCSRGALRSTLKLAHLHDDGKSQPRTGTPKCYTDADERNLLCHVRKNPKDSYAQVQKACGMTCSKSMIKRILVKHGIHNWRARRRPELTEENVAARLAWCLKYRYVSSEEWGLYMWSDECSVERG
jgi:Transposase